MSIFRQVLVYCLWHLFPMISSQIHGCLCAVVGIQRHMEYVSCVFQIQLSHESREGRPQDLLFTQESSRHTLSDNTPPCQQSWSRPGFVSRCPSGALDGDEEYVDARLPSVPWRLLHLVCGPAVHQHHGHVRRSLLGSHWHHWSSAYWCRRGPFLSGHQGAAERRTVKTPHDIHFLYKSVVEMQECIRDKTSWESQNQSAIHKVFTQHMN